MTAQELVEVDAIHACSGRRDRRLPAVMLEEGLHVRLLERVEGPSSRFGVRHARVDARQGLPARGDFIAHRERLLEREAPLQVVPQLARVARPRASTQRREQLGGTQARGSPRASRRARRAAPRRGPAGLRFVRGAGAERSARPPGGSTDRLEIEPRSPLAASPGWSRRRCARRPSCEGCCRRAGSRGSRGRAGASAAGRSEAHRSRRGRSCQRDEISVQGGMKIGDPPAAPTSSYDRTRGRTLRTPTCLRRCRSTASPFSTRRPRSRVCRPRACSRSR